MSGSIKADRIQKSAVEKTVDWFKETILQGFEGYRSAIITGSYNSNKSKKDYGDIDLVIQVDGKDLTEIRKRFQDYIKSLPDNLAIPFKGGKNKGKKVQQYGQVVICQIPIQGFEGLTVQVDCNFALSEKEQEFQKNYLDQPAEKLALIRGLVSVILQEEDPIKLFKKLHITKVPKLESNQAFEFHLSHKGLTLRKVTYEDFQEKDSEDVWKSRDWSDVETLLRGYDINQDFDGLLGEISSKLKKARSKRKMLATVQDMIKIPDSEKGTAKGDRKERALEKAEDKFAVGIAQDVEPKNVIALYGGGFKPVHRGYFSSAEKLTKKADRLIIFISPKVREGVPVTADQAKDIWQIYSKYYNIPVEVRVSQESPVQDILKLVNDEDHNDTNFIIGVDKTKEDKEAYQELKEKPNVTLEVLPTEDDSNLVASTLRQSVDIIKKGNWIPKVLDRDDARKVLDILLKPLQQEIVKEATEKAITGVLMNIKEGSTGGTHIMPTSVISSENREKLAKFYEKLQADYGDYFDINFNQSFIQIKVKWPGELQYGRNGFDYEMSQAQQFSEGQKPDAGLQEPDKAYWVRHMAGLVEFARKKGLKVDPLPEIILKKAEQDGSLLDKTGSYDKDNKVIELYTSGRHFKDIGRSFMHELVHHAQNLEGRLVGYKGDQISEDQNLLKLEEEATLKGYTLFREYTESLKK